MCPEAVLILTGVYDRNGALPSGIRIKEEIPDSEIRLFERSAHFPDVEETAASSGSLKLVFTDEIVPSCFYWSPVS